MQIAIIYKKGSKKPEYAAIVFKDDIFGVFKGGVGKAVKESLDPFDVSVFDVKVSVRGEIQALKFLIKQVSKKRSKVGFFESLFRNPQKIQAIRKSDKVWTSPELVSACIEAAGGTPIIRGKEHHQITIEDIANSPSLFPSRKTIN